MSKKKSQNDDKFIFSLIGVNIEKVLKQFGIFAREEDSIKTKTDKNPTEEQIPLNTTKITDLTEIKKTPLVVSFLDDSRHHHRCFLSTINFKTPNSYYKCFWDKNTIPDNIKPIGCPIRYVANRTTKTYHSEISKEQFSISENITTKRTEDAKARKDKRLTFEHNNYYETDGIFCSFNCCMAYLKDAEIRGNVLYKDSETLLLRMYNDLQKEREKYESSDEEAEKQEEEIKDILPAPHWRLLKEFGGHLTIDVFRESFNKIFYDDYGTISCSSIGSLYEDKIRI